jgi:hypothetical protein
VRQEGPRGMESENEKNSKALAYMSAAMPSLCNGLPMIISIEAARLWLSLSPWEMQLGNRSLPHI